MFGLGKRRYMRGEFEKCIEALLAGLDLASSRADEWFLVGMVAMRLEKLPLALKAFSRTLQVEPDRSEAWANVGSIFLHINQADKAFHALSQVRVCVV